VGHQRLKKLPKSRWWEQVVELLDDGGTVDELATATARAMDRALAGAIRDPALAQAVLLLASLPGAARQTNYIGALRTLDINAGAAPNLMDTLAGVERAIDLEARRSGGRTDLGEIAQLAAASSLTKIVSPDLPSLFGTTAHDVQTALAKLDTPDRFARLSRTFFADLMQRSLEYYLSRTYARHLGPRETFTSLAAQEVFRSALAEHCYQTALIVETYSADWFSKSKFEGGFSPQNVAVFTRTALAKLRQELRHRSRSDG
jgi:hypothetical protein